MAAMTDTAEVSSKAAPAVSVKAVTVCQVAVLAYPGTEDILTEVWNKYCLAPFKVVEFQAGSRLTDALARLVADTEIADEFALLPADMLPCCEVDLDDLSAPYVYWTVKPEGYRYDDRYPMKYSKASLVELLADEKVCATDESFIKAYFSAYRHRPIRCGYNVGNLVLPVRRGDPCEYKVIEGFLRYRFLAASPEGMKAITPLVRRYLLQNG